MRTLLFVLAALLSQAQGPAGPYPHAQRSLPCAAAGISRRVGAARAERPRARPGLRGTAAAAGEDPAAPGRLRRDHVWRTTASRRCTSRASPGSSSPATSIARSGAARSRRCCRRTAIGRTAASRTTTLASGPGRAINLARQGIRRLRLRHDRLQRQPPADAHLWRSRRETLGTEPGGPAALEQHPRAGFPRIAALRAARGARR